MIMKKLLLLSALCIAVFSAKAQNPGDVNKDGVVNSTDVVMVYNIIANGWYEPTYKEFTVNDVRFKMIVVEGGTFNMGATPEQENPFDYEMPAHQVTLSDYMIGETEVTQALWEAVMDNTPSYFSGASRPVEQVSWNDCQVFVQKLNRLTGQDFRLPTEAEWEYAARGGKQSKGYQYSGSNNVAEVAWYYDNSNNSTFVVRTNQPNELGIYNMSGNVEEWCQDLFGAYPDREVTNPTGPITGEHHVFRGGGWDCSANYCRNATRGNAKGNFSSAVLGLRLALSE